jgi:hypothetical protein
MDMGVTALNPGCELDALIAEKVMGCRVSNGRCGCEPINIASSYVVLGYEKRPHEGYSGAFRLQEQLPPYSTDIAAAWEVVEKVWKETWFSLDKYRHHETKEWVWDAGQVDLICGELSISNRVEGLTPAHAICLAALKALA